MKLLERNARAAGGEIDLVALDGDTIVFVEVKSRSTLEFGDPALAVGRTKQRNLVRAARSFLKMRGLLNRPRRYDVASVLLAGRERVQSVRWIKSAFDESE